MIEIKYVFSKQLGGRNWLEIWEGYTKTWKENQMHKSRGNEIKKRKEDIRMNMTIYNLMELEPNLLLEVLMLLETCGAENSVYMSVKNLSTMST